MLKSVYALVGPEPFLQLQKLGEVLQRLPKDAQRVDADGERAELSDVLDELRSFAMFGSTKVVVVRDAEAFISRFREQMEKYVEAPSDSGVLILRLSSLPGNQRIAKLIAKHGAIEKCEPPKPEALPAWIIAHGRSAYGLTVENDAAKLLAELIGTNLGRLDSEIGKLALKAAGGRVGVKDIAGTVAFQREQEMKEMSVALASGKVAEATKRWRQLLQADPSTEFRAVVWLTMWLEDVGVVLSAARRNALPEARTALWWKYREKWQAFVDTALALGDEGYRRALNLLAEVDQQSKSGVGDAADNVERFLLTLNL